MGLELYSSLPVLGFDVYVLLIAPSLYQLDKLTCVSPWDLSVLVGFLTAMFCMPLIRSRTEMVSPMIRRVAIRSVRASRCPAFSFLDLNLTGNLSSVRPSSHLH